VSCIYTVPSSIRPNQKKHQLEPFVFSEALVRLAFTLFFFSRTRPATLNQANVPLRQGSGLGHRRSLELTRNQSRTTFGSPSEAESEPYRPLVPRRTLQRLPYPTLKDPPA
jgi:hypothetical protein